VLKRAKGGLALFNWICGNLFVRTAPAGQDAQASRNFAPAASQKLTTALLLAEPEVGEILGNGLEDLFQITC
jgi:hypothetical protein